MIPWLLQLNMGGGGTPAVPGDTGVVGGWPERLGGRQVVSFSTPRIESFGGRKVERL